MVIIRQPKRRFVAARHGVKFFLIAEGLLFTGAYCLYAACNRSQTTRRYFHDRPYLRFILDYYYKIGEFNNFTAVRDFDRATWAAQDQLKGEPRAPPKDNN